MDECCKISVIVPVYNVEKFVGQCLDSIINQSLYEIEVLVLNDGSTDNSLSICNHYAQIDPRVKVYTHDNMGLGCTRNRGISLARGRYLAFVDSDDYIDKDGLKNLYEQAIQRDADVVQGETVNFNEDGSNCRIRRSLKDISDITIDDTTIEMFLKSYYFERIYSHNAWDKIYKTSFITKHNIEYGDNKKIFAEDNYFQLQIIHHKPKIAFVSENFYWYRQQENSIMHKPKQRLVERHGRMIEDYKKILDSSKASSIEYNLCSIVAGDVLIMEVLNQKLVKGKFVDYIKAMRTMKDQKVLKNQIKNMGKGAYRLEPKSGKRMYLFIVGWLYFLKLYDFAHLLTWCIYEKR